MQELINEIFSISEHIRYVAIYRNGNLLSSVKAGLEDASGSESDKYEELIVNPTLLTLLKQRGDIDCGGMKFVLVRYGNFYQYVAPTAHGHISICLSPQTDPPGDELAGKIAEALLKRHIRQKDITEDNTAANSAASEIKQF